MTDWLFDTALYTGILIAAALFLRRPVARLFGPQMAYALWALPLLRFVLPPIVLPASLAPEVPTVAPTQLPLEVLLANEDIAAQPAAEMGTILPENWPQILLVLWLASAAIFLVWRISNYLHMRRDVLAEARPVGEVGSIRLVETPAVASPVAFGVRDKVVALPMQFMAMEDRAARDLAIAHEVAHHHGRDILANFAAQPLLAMHWFNPLAWMGWRAMRRDQEAACDARVMIGRPNDERVAYARLIADFAAGPRLALAAPIACPMIGEKSIIYRLRSLSMSDVSVRRRLLGRALLGGAVLSIPLTASISYAADATTSIETVDVSPSAAADGDASTAGEQRRIVVRETRSAAEGENGADADEVNKRVFVFRKADGGEAERFNFEWNADNPLSPEQLKRLEELSARAAEMGTRFSADGERMAEHAERMAELQERLAEDVERRFVFVDTDCANAGPTGQTRTTGADGRQRIVICEKRIEANAVASAKSGLRHARDAIAANRDMSADVRAEVLRELDSEIARLEKEG